MFEFFDPGGELRVTTGSLPHWFQPEAAYFVTFRTEDSVPIDVITLWRHEQQDWLRRHGLKSADELGTLPAAAQREFHATFHRAFLAYLDRGFGACHLRRPELAAIVANSLRYFDGDWYDLDSFVVMPNHVHVLVGLRPGSDIVRTCYSWKQFTARAITRTLGRRGRFWQEESFDHVVRNADQFERIQAYIADNPVRAGLRVGEHLLYRRAGPSVLTSPVL